MGIHSQVDVFHALCKSGVLAVTEVRGFNPSLISKVASSSSNHLHPPHQEMKQICWKHLLLAAVSFYPTVHDVSGASCQAVSLTVPCAEPAAGSGCKIDSFLTLQTCASFPCFSAFSGADMHCSLENVSTLLSALLPCLPCKLLQTLRRVLMSHNVWQKEILIPQAAWAHWQCEHR